MAQSLSKIHIRINAFALPGRTNENTINTQGVASLALGYGDHWAFSPPHSTFNHSTSKGPILHSTLHIQHYNPLSACEKIRVYPLHQEPSSGQRSVSK